MPESTKKSKIQGLDSHDEKDYISDLPDSIIHHILSFLPSTNKRSKLAFYQRSGETNGLKFRFSFSGASMSKNFAKCIVNLLFFYKCSKIKKFECCITENSLPQLSPVTRLAIKNNVEELILHRCKLGERELPKLLFESASIVRLKLSGFSFMPSEKVKWRCLKVMELENCNFSGRGMENALSGSPLLETLELSNCSCDDKFVIASKSLKGLILCYLKANITEISCTKLKEMELFGWSDFLPFVVMNVLSLVQATLNFSTSSPTLSRGVVRNMLLQLQHVKELKIHPDFLKIMSNPEVATLSLTLVNNSLNLTMVRFDKHYRGVRWILQNFCMLETLVLKLQTYKFTFPDFKRASRNYWDSYGTVSGCLVSSLKIVEITGFSENNEQCKLEFDFAQFIMKNAKVLEKLVWIKTL